MYEHWKVELKDGLIFDLYVEEDDPIPQAIVDFMEVELSESDPQDVDRYWFVGVIKETISWR